MFGVKPKDSMKEFEQLRQAWKPGERRSEPTTGERGTTAGDNSEPSPKSSIDVAPLPGPAAAALPPRSTGASQPAPEQFSSVVSIGSTWRGNLKIEDSVRIDGVLSGEVEAGGTVLVSEGAQVDAKVRAAFVIIAGVFQGLVQCSGRLEVLPTGRVTGELTTKSLVVHEGAFLDGQIRMSHGEAKGESSAELSLKKERIDPGAERSAKGSNGTNGAGGLLGAGKPEVRALTAAVAPALGAGKAS